MMRLLAGDDTWKRWEAEGLIGKRKGQGRIEVRVDGSLVPFCYLADEEEGIAEGWAPDADGRKHLDPDNPEEGKRATYRGQVEIRIVPRTRPWSPRWDEQE